METGPASRKSTERKGEPEIDSIGPVYSSRSGIIVRETVLPVNGTSPEMRSADAGNTPEKLVETGLGSRPRCASFVWADSSTLEVEQGEEEGADQAIRAPRLST